MGQIVDSDNLFSRDVMYSEDEARISDWLGAEGNGPLFVSPVNDGVSPLETPNGETHPFGDTASTSLRVVPGENSRPTSSNGLVPGVPAPESDHLPPTAHSPKENDHPPHSRRSKLSNIDKETNIRQKSKKRKSLEIDQRNKRIASEFKELKQSISSLLVANTLHGLSEKDLRALLHGEGLIKDDLLECLNQNSCIWQEKGFWIKDALDLCITTSHLAEEKFCQVFRHTRTLAKRGSD